jgi:hypothetical protein
LEESEGNQVLWDSQDKQGPQDNKVQRGKQENEASLVGQAHWGLLVLQDNRELRDKQELLELASRDNPG